MSSSKWKAWWTFSGRLESGPDPLSALLCFALCPGGWPLRNVSTSSLALWLLRDWTNEKNQQESHEGGDRDHCIYSPSSLPARCGVSEILFLYLRQVPALGSALLQLQVPQSPGKLSFSLPLQPRGGNGFALLLVLGTSPAPMAFPWPCPHHHK